MWTKLVIIYWRISILKDSPENTPSSLILMIFMAIFFWLLVGIQWAFTDTNQNKPLIDGYLAGGGFVLVGAAFTYLLLFTFNYRSRFIQTLTCLFAVHVIVHLAAFPLLIITPWLMGSPMPHALAILAGIIYLLLTLALAIWQFLATAQVYKHALAIDMLPAIIASFGLLACNILIVSIWR